MRTILVISLLFLASFVGAQDFSGKSADTASLIGSTAYAWDREFSFQALPNSNWFILKVDSVSGYPNWTAVFSHAYSETDAFYPVDSVVYAGGGDTVITFSEVGMWPICKIVLTPADSVQKVFISGKRSVYRYEGDPP